MRHFLALSLLLALGCATAGGGRDRMETGFLNRSIAVGGVAYPYVVYVPRSYDPARAWPAILFLHGAGERGDDGLLQTEVGLPGAIRRNPERWPAIAVIPQAPEGRQWAGDAESIAVAALEAAQKEFRVDADRIYLTGLSMGGAGTWSLAAQHPRRFAAVVPICGWIVPMKGRAEWQRDISRSGLDPSDPYGSAARILRGVPVWIWHGAEDQSVPIDESRRMSAALEAAGGEVRYTELPKVGHNAWDPAYQSEELPRWLFAQRR
ncbi:MAG TPA: prolyl oligopeptidase family serine peptidase [Thermoanaerobaculia bacterium]